MEMTEMSEVTQPAPERGKKRTSCQRLDWIVSFCVYLFCTVRDDEEDNEPLHD